MKKYNYFEAVCEDVRDFITENEIEVNNETRRRL